MNLMFCLRRAVQFHGAKPASITPQGSVSWNDLFARVQRVAAFLYDLGIRKGDRVAVWMLNSHEYLELYYATMMAGIVIVPLNTRWNESDVAFTVSDSESTALIVDERFAPAVPVCSRFWTNRPKRIIYAGSGALSRRDDSVSRYSDTPYTFDEPRRRGPGRAVLYQRYHRRPEGRNAHAQKPVVEHAPHAAGHAEYHRLASLGAHVSSRRSGRACTPSRRSAERTPIFRFTILRCSCRRSSDTASAIPFWFRPW